MADPQDLHDLWLRQYHPAPEGGPTLVCFPYAGGAASSFRPLSEAMSPGVRVLSLQYPGRQDRRAEPVRTDLHALADEITRVLSSCVEGPLVFFGHSMGSTLAYETARRLEAGADGERVLGLVLSGRRGPGTVRHETVHLRDDAGIVEEAVRLDRGNAALLADPDIAAMALPVLRGDYTAVETYTPRPGARLRCPVSVLTGDADPQVTAEEAAAWARATDGAFRLRTFPGGHFYLNAQRAEVNTALAEDLAAFVSTDERVLHSAG
ncbi:alpha/beta fold hydrolase [Streptomyces sp. NPDC029216]|uniref:thioesterase II family protein n=1 Tax=Streptomyces sp. NPDC029216 TaxID=3154701 RepID=UPI00340C9C70